MMMKFSFRRHECPHCKCTNELADSVMMTLTIGSAIGIMCANPLCQRLYYLSWLGPWDGNTKTVAGQMRWERERKFSARFVK